MAFWGLPARRRREKMAYIGFWAPMRLALDTHGGVGGCPENL